uniref:Glycoside hydrolase family 19 catalytic domain-containing protein n=1 Tax=Emiliania huxleyi TaxID=2903 RepID=A0A6V2VRI7_EMIHU|mmetsp:Transcript_27226/g.81214  ORF Transcript_27226/g.81214 Transcript_27226/m.81214 type:complete len:697 (+) Transcript_27226:897-2987(+)
MSRGRAKMAASPTGAKTAAPTSVAAPFPDWGADGELTVTGQCNIFSWGTQCRPACAADAISCQLGLPSGQCQAGGEPAVPRRVECGRVGKCAGGEWANPTDTYMVRCCAETRLSSSWKQYANCDVWSESNGPEIGGCMRDKTLLEAEAICASAGARLCSAAELLADCARGTGCGFDSQLVWASDEQSLPDPAPGPLPGPAPDPQPMPTPVPAPDPQPTPAPAPDPNGDGSTCPPQGWERCGTTWPPLTTGYCCSAGGWYGITDDHCNPSKGGINALASCCAYNNDPNHPDYTYGMLVCSSQCDAPPAECTGVPAIDSVLAASDIGCQIGLTQLNDVYTWAGFCSAVRQFNAIGDRKLLLGDTEDPNGAAFGLSNVAALLAQCMWESGGEAPFTACDENDYPPSSPTASCTQRSDGELYHSLNDQPWACYVDPQMTMTAETWASWAPGPLKCEPGTGSEKCCWWGRGAIQTTGPNNYGLLQREVFSKVPALGGIDLCTNPEAICQRDDAKWLGAIFYWANNVQGFGLEAEAATFAESLRKFVESGFDRSASVVAGADFAAGTGGVVNNGYWSARPHGHNERLRYFDFIVAQLKAAGMQTVGIPRPPPSPKPPPPSPPRRPKPSPPPGGTSGGGSGNSGGGGGGIDCVNQPLTGSFSAYSCETYEEMICSGWPETGPSGMCGYCQYDDVADNCCKCRS